MTASEKTYRVCDVHEERLWAVLIDGAESYGPRILGPHKEERPTLPFMQEAVGGLITSCPGWPGYEQSASKGKIVIDGWANDEGILLGMRPSLTVTRFQQTIHGPILVVASNEHGESLWLTFAEACDVMATVISAYREKSSRFSLPMSPGLIVPVDEGV